MALLLKAEDIKGLISIEEAIEAVESGFRDQAKHPQFSLPRHRMMAGDRRINIHSGGCVDLGIAGTFIHYERHRYTKEDQTYAAAGKPAYGAIWSSVSMISSRVAPFFRAILILSSSPWDRPKAARAEIVQRLFIFSGSPLLDQISPERNSST